MSLIKRLKPQNSSNFWIGKQVKVRYLYKRKYSSEMREIQGKLLKIANKHGFVMAIIATCDGQKICPFPTRPESIRKYRFSIEQA